MPRRPATARTTHPAFARALAVLGALGVVLAGCAKPAGVLFETADTLITWPPPPDLPRIRYIGQLRTADDLHASRSALQQLGRAVFGPSAPQGVLVGPMGVCTDNGERVFIADRAAGAVHAYNLKSRTHERWGPPAADFPRFEPVSLAYDPAGRLFVSDPAAGLVHVFHDDGVHLGTLGDNELNRPVGLAFQPATQSLYVADAGDQRVAVLSMQDTLLTAIGRRGSGPGEFNHPTYLTLARDGRLYVSDSLNSRVQVFSPEGVYERSVGSRGDLPGYFSQPKGVAVDDEGRLFVVDANFEAVQIFDVHGAVLMSFGQEGHAPGEFWLPVDIQIDESGRIWVADSYNQRVQVFELVPQAAEPSNPEESP
jgi:DNA-binding beta-propeller fold protein YncE